jgi:polyhydroxybutyrate depolymerase
LISPCILAWLFFATYSGEPLAPGDYVRKLTVDGRHRTYLVHAPPHYDPAVPTPVVLIFHGAAQNARSAVRFTGMNEKSDQAGFLAVYPEGTGVGILRTFNAGGRLGKHADKAPDDVHFTRALLDDLAESANVDPRRIYATGMSNGAMMCYRLAAEMSDRIAAVGPVSGTMAVDEARTVRPVPVMHFHGTADRIVPFTGPDRRTPKFLTFKSVPDTIAFWVAVNDCPAEPEVVHEPDLAADGTTVVRKTYGPGVDGAEVVLFVVEGGGHTWPGRKPALHIMGASTKDVSANDLLWEFFCRFPMK